MVGPGVGPGELRLPAGVEHVAAQSRDPAALPVRRRGVWHPAAHPSKLQRREARHIARRRGFHRQHGQPVLAARGPAGQAGRGRGLGEVFDGLELPGQHDEEQDRRLPGRGGVRRRDPIRHGGRLPLRQAGENEHRGPRQRRLRRGERAHLLRVRLRQGVHRHPEEEPRGPPAALLVRASGACPRPRPPGARHVQAHVRPVRLWRPLDVLRGDRQHQQAARADIAGESIWHRRCHIPRRGVRQVRVRGGHGEEGHAAHVAPQWRQKAGRGHDRLEVPRAARRFRGGPPAPHEENGRRLLRRGLEAGARHRRHWHALCEHHDFLDWDRVQGLDPDAQVPVRLAQGILQDEGGWVDGEPSDARGRGKT
mmetsp:Transcript_48801/g.148464  ORF Transcript_48801/g.148464 Transcript_48801/m.148464 type:complete len:366 (+) Transcript_48801:603-1700(+)